MTPARGGGCHVSVLGYKENVNLSYGKKKKKKNIIKKSTQFPGSSTDVVL